MSKINNFLKAMYGVVSFAILLPFVFVGGFFMSVIILATLPLIPIGLLVLFAIASITGSRGLSTTPLYSCNLIYFEDLDTNVLEMKTLKPSQTLESSDVSMTG